MIKIINNLEVIMDEKDWLEFEKDELFIGVNGKYLMIKRNNKIYYAHKLLLKCSENQIIDHINLNSLDNRKCNLRVVNRSQNSLNRNKQKGKNNKSIFKGVTYDRVNKNWYCRVQKNGTNIFSGRFKDEISAALAYNYYAKKEFGEFVKLNKIDEELNINWRDNQLIRSFKNNTDYKYIYFEESQNKWKACVQSKKYGNSKKKSFKNEYEAVLYCNDYIIKNNLKDFKKIQILKDTDVINLSKELLEIYNNQLREII